MKSGPWCSRVDRAACPPSPPCPPRGRSQGGLGVRISAPTTSVCSVVKTKPYRLRSLRLLRQSDVRRPRSSPSSFFRRLTICWRDAGAPFRSVASGGMVCLRLRRRLFCRIRIAVSPVLTTRTFWTNSPSAIYACLIYVRAYSDFHSLEDPRWAASLAYADPNSTSGFYLVPGVGSWHSPESTMKRSSRGTGFRLGGHEQAVIAVLEQPV